MKNFSNGIKGKAEINADASTLAVNVGSGSLEVFATPMMAMLMEKAACNCLAEYLENDETTVGTELNITHISATPAGMNVYAISEVSEINGREICFNVEAYDECSLIGKGTHKRFLVFAEKFMQKTNSKLNK